MIKTHLSKIILGTVICAIGFLGFANQSNAEIWGANFFRKSGNAIIMTVSSWTLGSASNRIDIYADNLDTNTLTINDNIDAGNLSMGGYDITNGGTFTAENIVATSTTATNYFLGDVGIGTTSPSQELDLIGDLELEMTTSDDTGVIYKGADRFIHNFQHPTGNTAVPAGQNTFIGVNAGNFTMGSTATETYHGSYNSAMGMYALRSNTIGNSNSAMGMYALYSNTTGTYNSAMGRYALYSNTIGNSNSAMGMYAGRYIADGSTANTTGDYNVFLGHNTKALADNDQNEIVIGYNATGVGSNSVVLGNDSVTKTILKGNVGIGTTTPPTKLTIDGACFELKSPDGSRSQCCVDNSDTLTCTGL